MDSLAALILFNVLLSTSQAKAARLIYNAAQRGYEGHVVTFNPFVRSSDCFNVRDQVHREPAYAALVDERLAIELCYIALCEEDCQVEETDRKCTEPFKVLGAGIWANMDFKGFNITCKGLPNNARGDLPWARQPMIALRLPVYQKCWRYFQRASDAYVMSSIDGFTDIGVIIRTPRFSWTMDCAQPRNDVQWWLSKVKLP